MSLCWNRRPGFARDLQSAGWRYHYVVHECHGGTWTALVYDRTMPIDAHRDATADARSNLVAWCETRESNDQG